MTQSIFVIERGLPVPPRMNATTRRGRKREYPFNSLGVGDSFVMTETTTVDKVKLQQRIIASAGTYRRKVAPGTKFTTRQTETGVRVWRIA